MKGVEVESVRLPATMKANEAEQLKLEQYAPLIYVAHPDYHAAPVITPAPSVILICGWMDAQLRHVYKYVEPYRRLFPHVPVIVMLSTVDSCFRSSTKEWKKNADIVQRILREAGKLAYEKAPNEPQTVFIHGFSNGGLISLDSLMEHMDDPSPTFPQPVGSVLDSLPGYDSARVTLSAVIAGIHGDDLKARLTRAYTQATMTVLHYVRQVTSFMGGRAPNINFAKAYINKPQSWAWRKGTAPLKCPPRLYLHTRADEYISPDAVDEHAVEVQRVNQEEPAMVVEAENLKNSVISWPPLHVIRTRRMVWNTPKHVQIARMHPTLYWSAIETFVRDTMSMIPSPIKSRL